MSAATMNSISTFPAAFATAHTAMIASGSNTSWTQRGTTARGGSCCALPVESVSCRSSALGAAASGAFSEASLTSLPPLPEYG